ncbi:Glycosyl hydrolases family 31-domain-containing protein [Mycena kentingensis (nom. inval.)]|nr:Glycosyl hydrolases family 31-domain-containing protein [Mycena kentingensis (nom. inval.)]
MPRIHFPTAFKPESGIALLHLKNPAGHSLGVQPISDNVVRVVHQLPVDKFPQKTNKPIAWEPAPSSATVSVDATSAIVKTNALTIKIDFDGCPRLEWERSNGVAFHADSRTRGYAFDAASGSVMHYVERELYLPRNEFVYGLGESRGGIMKAGKKFTMEGRDALSYDWEHGDPLYKLNPFYTVYNKKTNIWHGIFYNNISDSSFDMGAEVDVLWGCFRVYKANSGPLDYYVIFGDGTLPSVLSEYARLVSPCNKSETFAASPTLPPLSQFGYLSSSLGLSADPKAQSAVIGFLEECRKYRFPVDGLHLSSGWCQDVVTNDRNYFVWNRERYPDPAALGRIVEQEFGVQLIVNVKPWLLAQHPKYEDARARGAFIQPAPDADPVSKAKNAAMSWVWAVGFASHKPGSYFDYSTEAASAWWGEQIRLELLANGLTGLWIDNNEMAGMFDDEERFKGEVGMFARDWEDAVEKRMGWAGGETRVGSVGKGIQTMGMARATYEAVLAARPTHRPVIVSRSGIPGIQAYAHATWSGDNSTTWKALEWGTKMTLSVGMSFGPGLYGHDIGGFAGQHHPSPELLVRWCQNGAWHTRFTVHSWKEISTTLWMYDDVPGISDAIRAALDLRYRLAPTFYSLYVTHYYRNGWPVLKPLLWHHSVDPKTLQMDEEIVFGSHVLVAPVTKKGATTRAVYLPAEANDSDTKGLWWCELDTGVWARGQGRIAMLRHAAPADAPLERIPTLVRSSGILVFGGACTKNIYDGVGERTARVFPAPAGASKGSFMLIEDDGRSNAHTHKGVYTELLLSFECAGDGAGEVVVNVEVLKGGYKLPYEVVWFELPAGDKRKVVGKGGKVQTSGDGKAGVKVGV